MSDCQSAIQELQGLMTPVILMLTLWGLFAILDGRQRDESE